MSARPNARPHLNCANCLRARRPRVTTKQRPPAQKAPIMTIVVEFEPDIERCTKALLYLLGATKERVKESAVT